LAEKKFRWWWGEPVGGVGKKGNPPFSRGPFPVPTNPTKKNLGEKK